LGEKTPGKKTLGSVAPHVDDHRQSFGPGGKRIKYEGILGSTSTGNVEKTDIAVQNQREEGTLRKSQGGKKARFFHASLIDFVRSGGGLRLPEDIRRR